MTAIQDGPGSALFTPLAFQGNTAAEDLPRAAGFSKEFADRSPKAPTGDCICWGIPFRIDQLAVVGGAPVTIELAQPAKTPWLVFLHTTDLEMPQWNRDGLIEASRGWGKLKERVADYVLVYTDGSQARHEIRRRHQIGMISRIWGENCFEAVGPTRPHAIRPLHEPVWEGGRWPGNPSAWGHTQQRVGYNDAHPWMYWLWAWQNPQPGKKIAAVRLEPAAGRFVVAALTAGKVASHPLRWETRRKAILTLPPGREFDPTLDERGLNAHVQLDLGTVISIQRRSVFDNAEWIRTHVNQLPEISERELIVEYAAHHEAAFHLEGGKTVPVAKVAAAALVKHSKSAVVTPVAPSTQRVTLRVVEKATGRPVAVKLHVHGEAGEYLAPVDRHRIVNRGWFEDYSCDCTAFGKFSSTYINGETTIDLPVVYPRMTVFYHGYNWTTSLNLQGPARRRWLWSLDNQVLVCPPARAGFAYEMKGLLVWDRTPSFQIRFGYLLSYAEYPFGRQWHLLPLLDLQWRSK
ncbi:MAG: hypothetical protein BWY83_02252 [bacterium ADurb.Bin478]|nr:MAG: hypothetical protein BWY83_02252 [bacterium ADurb.Bin478]